MRTKIAIDDDVVVAARRLAAQDRRRLGEVISDLARLSLNQTKPVHYRNGVPLLNVKDATAIVTLELVNALRDEAQ